MKVRDIPKCEEFERLQHENPAEYRRLYRESMECLKILRSLLSWHPVASVCSLVALYSQR